MLENKYIRAIFDEIRSLIELINGKKNFLQR